MGQGDGCEQVGFESIKCWMVRYLQDRNRLIDIENRGMAAERGGGWEDRGFRTRGKMLHQDFPGGLVVKILGFHCGGPGSIPGWRRSHKPHGVTKRKSNTRTYCMAQGTIFNIL